jgi:hypothetical protein
MPQTNQGESNIMAHCKLTLVDVGDGKGAMWHIQSHPPLLTHEQEEGLSDLEVRNSRTLAQNMVMWGVEGIYHWMRIIPEIKALEGGWYAKQGELSHKPTSYFPGERIKDVISVCTLIIIDGADGKVHYRYKCVPKHFPTDMEEVWVMKPEELFKRLTPALNMLLAATNGMNHKCAKLGLHHKVSPNKSYSV